MSKFILLVLFTAAVALACDHNYDVDSFDGSTLEGHIYERNVKDYGAVGDGITDDSWAIIRAITEGRGDCDPLAQYPNATYSESTVYPAYVYFPAGTYLVTQSIPIIYYTEVVGDPYDLPTIVFVSDSDNDTTVLDAAGFWYPDINQDNFYRHIRNFIVDMTRCKKCTGLHWQVSQATSISNMIFKSGIGSKNRGMFMENGSGGFFSDVLFEGGTFGMWVGNQQFTVRNVTIRDVSVAGIYMNWDFVWTIKGLHVYNAPIGVDINNKIGSLTLLDSDFHNISDTVIRSKFTRVNNSAASSVYIENTLLELETGTRIITTSDKEVLVADNPVTVIKSYGQGFIWNRNHTPYLGTIQMPKFPKRPLSLTPFGSEYFEMGRPEFKESELVDVTEFGVVGDGKTDITEALQKVLLKFAYKKVLLFPHGVYLISNTIYVPAGTRMIGRAWSLLNAYGTQTFQDANNPRPMLQVGLPGEIGVAQMIGFMITTRGPQPGAILVEWNLHDPVGQPGSCGMWDLHFRIGGGITTDMHYSNCPRGDGSDAPASQCSGAWALIHITQKGNLYMENVWGWVADHDVDQKKQINIYNPRGILIESHGPVWLYGTAMEHHGIYQYNFYGAKDIFAGVMQTETAYYQPALLTPFDPSDFRDPWFCDDDFRCNMSYALQIKKSRNVFIYGTGFYSFYNNWNQSCLHDTPFPLCQQNIVALEDNNRVFIFSLNTYGSVHMLTSREPFSLAAQNPDWLCANAVVDLHHMFDESEGGFNEMRTSLF